MIKFYQYLNQEGNKEIKAKIEEARKIGVQNIVDKLLDIYQADINQDTLDPNLISWIREKTKFIQWIAGKTSDLYSDKKDLTLNKTTNNQIIVSWLDSPELEQKYTQYEKINEEVINNIFLKIVVFAYGIVIIIISEILYSILPKRSTL